MYTLGGMQWVRGVQMHASPKAVLVALVSRMDAHHACHPSQALLASDTGLSERTVRSCLLYLEEMGLIARQRRSNGTRRKSDQILVQVGARSPQRGYTEWFAGQSGSWARPVKLSYRAARMRVTRDRGPAAEYPCLNCTGEASIWVYDGTDPDEVMDSDGRRYSGDIARYWPMCRRCGHSTTGNQRPLNRQPATIEPATTAAEDIQEDNHEDTQVTLTCSSTSVRVESQREFAVSAAMKVLTQLEVLIPELDDDALWRWYAEGMSSPPNYQNAPELNVQSARLIHMVHDELKRRLNPQAQ